MEGIDIGANTRTTTIPSLVMGEQMKAKWESELTKNLPQLGSRLQQKQNEVKHSWIDSDNCGKFVLWTWNGCCWCEKL